MQVGFIGWAFVIAAGVATADVALLVIAPLILRRNSAGTPGRCRLLGLIAAAPSVLGEPGRVFVRLELLRMLNDLGRAEEALEHGERLLELKLLAILESEVRFQVADSLDTLGRPDESRWQRSRAQACLEGVPPDAASLFQSGRLKEAQGDLPGALEDYSKAARFAGPAKSETKAKALLRLACAEFHAGRVDDSARHATELAELAANPRVRLGALLQASLSYSNQGDLERSEHYDRIASELARELGSQKELALALAHMGENLRKRGRLADALEAVEKARQIEDVRACHTLLSSIHLSAGRFDKALEEFEVAGRTGVEGLGRLENKMQAIFDLTAFRLLVEFDRIDEAAERLDRSAHALASDPKQTLLWKAASARIAALRGERERAHALMAEVEDGQGKFAGDRSTQHLCLTLRAQAFQSLGELDEARATWERYLVASPDPVFQPGALYQLGECLLGQGDQTAAIDFYQRADALGLETHGSNQARRRLAELGRSTAEPDGLGPCTEESMP